MRGLGRPAFLDSSNVKPWERPINDPALEGAFHDCQPLLKAIEITTITPTRLLQLHDLNLAGGELGLHVSSPHLERVDLVEEVSRVAAIFGSLRESLFELDISQSHTPEESGFAPCPDG